MRVFVHDSDEYLTSEQEVMFAVGQAQFSLRDFLRPYCKELKMRSDVFPMKKGIVDTTTQLDLNKTARMNEKTLDKFCPYLLNNTYVVISCNLAHPIGSFL